MKFLYKKLELPWAKNEKDCNQKRCSVNKSCLYWNIFESLSDCNTIILHTTSKKSTNKDDEAFSSILRGVETRMSEKY